MKKIIFILLSIMLLSGCQSNPNSTKPQTFSYNPEQYTTENIGEDENHYLVQSPSDLEKPVSESILTEPPILTISTLNGSVEALRGTTSWLYDNGDGTWTGIESDSMHPLDSNTKQYMPTLLIASTSHSSKKPVEAVLQFDVTPDEVSIHCWSDEHWGHPFAKSEDILINDFSIELKNSGYIYEIIAHWNSSEKYRGTAYYSFYAEPSDFSEQTIPDK